MVDPRLVLLSQIYFPEPETRVHLLGKGLVERGYAVTVVTGFPNYPLGRVYDGYHQTWRRWEEKDGVRILRVPLVPDHSRSLFRRSLCYASFATTASLLGGALCGRADLIWVYHPPITNTIPGWWMSVLRRAPFVLEIQDMWPETLAATGVASNNLLQQSVAAMAGLVYRHARAIIVISPGFKRNLIQKGVPPEKIHIIPNWVDDDLSRAVPIDPALAMHLGLAGRFNIVYAGNMGPAQGLGTVIDAAKLLTDRPNVQFVMIGDGLDRAFLERRVSEEQIDNIRFLPRQPMERMPSLYALADALLVSLKRDPLFEITIPGKTQTYLASGRPIIVVAAGDAAELVERAGGGIPALPGDPGDLARAVRQLHDMTAAERDAIGLAGRAYVLKHLSRRALLARYEEVFRQVAGIRARPSIEASVE